MTSIQIMALPGMLGIDPDGDPLYHALSLIGHAFGEQGDWGAKYGADVENSVFLMRRFCWCGSPECLWCAHEEDHPPGELRRRIAERFGSVDGEIKNHNHYTDPPNFWYKPTDFRCSWYKYIGRSMEINKLYLPSDFLPTVFSTHPKGMTLNEAIQSYQEEVYALQAEFAAMLAEFGAEWAADA